MLPSFVKIMQVSHLSLGVEFACLDCLFLQLACSTCCSCVGLPQVYSSQKRSSGAMNGKF